MRKKIHIHFLWICCIISAAISLSASHAVTGPPMRFDTSTAPFSKAVRYLALGDSYTIGQSVAATDRFPVQAVSILREAGFAAADADIIATTGWTTTNLLNALKNKPATQPYDFVSLLIGVNNQFRGTSIVSYKTEFTALLKKSIELAGNRPQRVVVVSIPDYSVTPFAVGPIDREKIAREIDAFNRVNRQLANTFHVQYLNVTHESRRAGEYRFLVASDGLHFSGLEYRIWAEMLAGMMQRSIGIEPNPTDSLYTPVQLTDGRIPLP